MTQTEEINYQLIQLGKKGFTKVDKDDFVKFSKFKWWVTKLANGTFPRAYRSVQKNGKVTRIYLSREILNAPKGVFVDHINGDSLDNRKLNLRLSNSFQNNCNRKPMSNNKSGFKGIYQSKGKYMARITKNKKRYFIGTFLNKEDAAKAYDVMAKKLFGNFAWLNFL